MCYPYEIHWGKIRNFLNRKRLSYFLLQEIPDLFSYHKYSNMQLYIRRWFIICMCKFLVQNFIIKDILKKKNVVHWISVRTIVYTGCAYKGRIYRTEQMPTFSFKSWILDIMRQSACLVATQSRFIAMISFNCTTRWVRPQTQWRLWRKALIGGLVPDAWL